MINSKLSFDIVYYFLLRFIREKLRPIIKTEEQFLYLCHLVGPFLQRFHLERTRCLLDVSILELRKGKKYFLYNASLPFTVDGWAFF